ncbi:uncharacterized protein [Euphorbia lathyris]|uniref:uncharacterized protein n=1 Tax=Euphorbia lathyris TaxID=212925 RepID=UPI003313C3FB
MGKPKTIDAFFKRKRIDESENITPSETIRDEHNLESQETKSEQYLPKLQRLEFEEVDIANLERDPGLRPQIWEYPINQRDEIRRAYLRMGPYQIHLEKYPLSGPEKHPRRFSAVWFKLFPSWLEYSKGKDAAYCLACYLFSKKLSGRLGADVFTVSGFNKWKKVNDGKRCAFLTHIGEDPCSTHNNAMRSCEDLLNQSQHIENVIHVQSEEKILKNRLRLRTSIDSIRWLTFQTCAFRGHDESTSSRNRGNFLEMVQILANYNDEVRKVVLENAPYNSKYTSPLIQKEILSIIAKKVREYIREEIGDSKFCIIVDESRDESKREQMAIVLRFVDSAGFIQERFLHLVHVKDTMAVTLKQEICTVLSRYSLDIQNIRGQGYDGASNMRGEWNGLRALFLKDCPYAYYVHCFAHRLQLALVAASREVFPVYHFFNDLSFIINTVCSSTKRYEELRLHRVTELEKEEEEGRGCNQIGTLKRAGDTHWGSHFFSVCSLIEMYHATSLVLLDMKKKGANFHIRGDGDGAHRKLKGFEFVFILHLMKETMGITNILCQALQQKSQDIVNAMHLVGTTKALIQKLRDDGWDSFINKVKLFCDHHHISIPDFSAPYAARRTQARGDSVATNTWDHFYRREIFYLAIDKQVLELNDRFSEEAIELLTLSSSLLPKNSYNAFNIENICRLAEKYYPMDFSDHKRINLKFQLQHFILDAPCDPNLKDLSTLAELSKVLEKTEKSKVYFLLTRLIRLLLTLPVSTATSERAFSAMKLVKTRLRNKMEDGFLANSLVVHIEREIAEKFDSDTIIDEFKSLKNRRASL